MTERKAEREKEERRNFLGFIYQTLSAKANPEQYPTNEDLMTWAKTFKVDDKPELLKEAIDITQKFTERAKAKKEFDESRQRAEDVREAWGKGDFIGAMGKNITGQTDLNSISKAAEQARKINEPPEKKPLRLGDQGYSQANAEAAAAEEEARRRVQQQYQDPQQAELNKLKVEAARRAAQIPQRGTSEYLNAIEQEESTKARVQQQNQNPQDAELKRLQVDQARRTAQVPQRGTPEYNAMLGGEEQAKRDPGAVPDNIKQAQALVMKFAGPENPLTSAIKALVMKDVPGAANMTPQNTVPPELQGTYNLALKMLKNYYN
jgi:hypothetical protein